MKISVCAEPENREAADIMLENPNAFALLGDRIFINTGESAKCRLKSSQSLNSWIHFLTNCQGYLFECQTIEQVAGVLAHEAAHLIARHGSEEISSSYFAQQIKIWFDYRGRMGENFGLCRIHEFESDHIGLIIIAEAGFNPQHILDFMAIGVGSEEEYWRRKEAPPEFLRNHPSVRNPLLTGEEKLTDLPGKESFSRPSKTFARSS
jgi:predicted Zn-dependent protease